MSERWTKFAELGRNHTLMELVGRKVWVALVDPDGRETTYEGYRRQRLDKASISGPKGELLFPTCTGPYMEDHRVVAVWSCVSETGDLDAEVMRMPMIAISNAAQPVITFTVPEESAERNGGLISRPIWDKGTP